MTAVDASDLVGQVQSRNIGLVPLVNIAGGLYPNLLVSSGFDAATSLDSSGAWSWDGTVGYTRVGSATASADGTDQPLYSNLIEVTEGQELAMSMHFMWTGLTAAADTNPIQISAAAYDTNNNQLTTAMLASVASPASSSEWVELSGIYTVPAGVAYVACLIELTADATAGQVWADDGAIARQGTPEWYLSLLTDIQSNANNLLSLLQSLGADANYAIEQAISYVESALTGVIPAIVDLGDGTGKLVGDIIDNADGTATLVEGAANVLIDNADGTLTSIGQTLQNAANAAAVTAARNLSGAVLNVQATVDTLMNSWGVAGTNFVQSQLQALAQSIPYPNIQGVLGPGDLGSAVRAVVNGAYAGLTGIADAADIGIETLQSQLSGLVMLLGYRPDGSIAGGSTAAIAQTNSANTANRAVTKPSWQSIESSTDWVFPPALIQSQSPLPTVAVTQASTSIGFLTVTDAGVQESCDWLGYPTGGSMSTFTAFYLNIYQLNVANAVNYPNDSANNNPSNLPFPASPVGELVWLRSTPNIVELIAGGSTPVWNAYDFGVTDTDIVNSDITTRGVPGSGDTVQGATFINANQGDVFAVELQVYGSGTYNVLGMSNYIPSHPTAIPAKDGASRSNPASFAPASLPAPVADPTESSPVGYVNSTPNFGLSGTTSQTLYPSVLQSFTSSGTYDPPEWANYFDIVICGGGGGGVAGAAFVGGVGGNAGGWNQQRLTKSQISGAAWTVTLGGGGGNGPAGSSAGNGGATTVVVPGWGTLSAYGGAGGVGNEGLGDAFGGPGWGPGNDSFPNYYGDPNVYYGGAQENSPQGNGNQPGGGGAGGNAFFAVGSYIYGGFGAPGGAFILAYQ
ncbi:hypothetical protein [Mycobacterium malmoense]|uniref:glycine-rich domain-containing protein n=1 Tax=Mycobacterium malmoense TaxID=1780 RepID=UPI00114D4AF6|nr:hypothetical protein [Mycobacterium malmoense]